MKALLRFYYRARGHSAFTAELLARTVLYFGFAQARNLSKGVKS